MTDTHDGGPPAAAPVHTDHGNSVAAWSGVIVITVGSLVAAIGVGAGSMALFVVGMVVAVLVGPAVWRVMSAMGFGPSGKTGH